jgi:hypothetical protein
LKKVIIPYNKKRLDSKIKPQRLFYRKANIAEFIIDENQINAGSFELI